MPKKKMMMMIGKKELTSGGAPLPASSPLSAQLFRQKCSGGTIDVKFSLVVHDLMWSVTAPLCTKKREKICHCFGVLLFFSSLTRSLRDSRADTTDTRMENYRSPVSPAARSWGKTDSKRSWSLAAKGNL